MESQEVVRPPGVAWDEVARKTSEMPRVTFEKERGVLAASSRGGTTLVQVDLAGEDEPAAMLACYERLGELGVSIQMMRQLPGALCFLADSGEARRAQNGLLGLRDAVRDVKLTSELSIVEVTADNMREMSGVMARVLDALGKAGVEPLQFADSHKALCILTSDAEAADALAALKQEFGL